jgi:hypothetical protein
MVMPDASGFKHPSVAAERQTAFTIDASISVASRILGGNAWYFRILIIHTLPIEMQLSQSLHTQWHAESRVGDTRYFSLLSTIRYR